MERRKFTREFKLEAVRLITDRGVSYSQASQDLKVHPTQLRNWVKAFADDPQHAFPSQGQMKPEQLEILDLSTCSARCCRAAAATVNWFAPLPSQSFDRQRTPERKEEKHVEEGKVNCSVPAHDRAETQSSAANAVEHQLVHIRDKDTERCFNAIVRGDSHQQHRQYGGRHQVVFVNTC